MGNSQSAPDNIIACIGPMNSGKSRIIDCLAGTTWASNSLAGSGVQTIRSAKIKVNGSTVILIDTPGFDQYNVLFSNIVEQIERWLNKKYKKNVRLTGILYLHPITDNRMTKVPPKNLRRLLEPGGACKVILVTTMWNMSRPEVAENRERQLHTTYWKEMLDLGARTARFDGQESTARQIVEELIASR